MNYFVIAADGQKYGPADVPTLNQWAQEGRVLNTSMLEDAATGQRVAATSVPGINFPQSPQHAPNYGGQPNYGQPNYQQAPGQYMGGDNGQDDITKVWIFSVLSVLQCCPILFGILAIIYASKAQQKGHPQGQTAMIVAIVCLCVGLGGGLLIGLARLR